MARRRRWSDFPPDEQGWRSVRSGQKRTGQCTVCSCGRWTYNDKLAAGGAAAASVGRASRRQGSNIHTHKQAVVANQRCRRSEASQTYGRRQRRRTQSSSRSARSWAWCLWNGIWTTQAVVAGDEKAKRAVQQSSRQVAEVEGALARKQVMLAEAAAASFEAKRLSSTHCSPWPFRRTASSATSAGANATAHRLERAATPLALGCALAGFLELAEWKAGLDWVACSSDPDICRKADGLWTQTRAN